MRLEGLGADILYTELFPLLNGFDLMCLYRAYSPIKPYIAAYRDWDRAYFHDFASDVLPTQGSGIARYFRRLEALVWTWGECTNYAGSDVDIPFGKYLGGTGNIRIPHAGKTPGIAQYIHSLCYKTLDGYVTDPPLRLSLEDAWLHSGTYDSFAFLSNKIFWMVAGNQYIWQGPDESQVVHVDTGFDRATILVRGYGLTEWKIDLFGPEFVTFESTKLQIPESQFPTPMLGVLSNKSILGNSVMVFVGENGRVYTRTVDGQWNELSLKGVASVHAFAIRFKREENQLFSDSYGAIHSSGFLARLKDGSVVYHVLNGSAAGQSIKLGGFERIYKLVVRESALVALDNLGRVFFMGDTNKLNAGLGDYLGVDTLLAQTLEEGLEDPGLVTQANQVPNTDYPYILQPRQITTLGFAVNINVCMRECSAIVLKE